ncbi:LysR family transcriptional regulator [Psychrobacillus sp. OK032]|uniref:LysR family transcriptional regulator n=1 Tax=Psychrobacillus sp. OK032 TaxID=1884358 RepID=UPI0008AF13D7|nr:LysR family transcriptional regulator [Psychrobacillus sp. OK032]SES43908.1 DNA-binding transcriptional regulator, LysR family [Psychrobacillus sp. OK032]
MEWQYIKYFLTVAGYEHMTKSAKELNITQPALSRSISKLEEELGVELFIRENKRIKLNRYGHMFKERALKIQTEMRLAQKEIDERLNPDFGEISIGFFHTLGIDKLPKLLANFKEKYPKTTFKLTQANKKSLINMIYDDKIDFCFTTITGDEVKKNYSCHHLWDEKLYLTVSKQHKFASRQLIEIDELVDEEFVVLKEGYGLRTITDKIFKQASLTPKVSFEGEEIDTIAGLVSANLGISFLPKLQGNQIVEQIEITDPVCQRTIGIIWNENALISPITKKFFEHVINYFSRNESN